MNNTRDFDSILEECLEAVLSGQRSLDDCLSRYPAQAAELRPLLQVALLTNRLKKPAMSPASVDALEKRLRSQVAPARREQRRVFNFAPYQKLAAMVALVFLLTIGAGGGAVAASANALPGDFLYPLKRLWEAIILALASLNAAQDEIWLHLAETRLDEAENLAQRDLLSRVVWIDLYEATAQSIILVDEDSAPQLLDYLQQLRQGLDELPVTAETESLRADLLLLILPGDSSGIPLRPSLRPANSFAPDSADEAAPTDKATVTATAMPSATASQTPTVTASETPVVSPTSRVPATATDTPTPAVTDTNTPTQTLTPVPTSTATWTALPLPGASLTDRPDSASNSGVIQRQTATRRPTLDQTATVRYRDTQAAIYATLTQQAQSATEEVRPDE